jgi:hypothetical protein
MPGRKSNGRAAKMATRHAQVLRKGQPQAVPTADLAPSDELRGEAELRAVQ